MHNIDLSMENICKVEGSASLDLRVEEGKVSEVHFGITEYKRFFTEAMKGKSIMAMPQHLARICGTCSNAHLMCAITACEDALGMEPTEQTKILRALTMHGLMIRDHALHLYLFSLPDIYGKDAFLEFDENIEEEHQLLHDGFDTKAAGNFLATLVAGRSVHAMYPTIGGFLKFPDEAGVAEAIKKLEAVRPAALRLIEIFRKAPFHFNRNTQFMALIPDGNYGYIGGKIMTSKGETYEKKDFRKHLEQVVLPYSQASAYIYGGEGYMVGAMARLNLAKDKLNPKTKESLAEILKLFPSTDIFYNNLAQAVEILHSIDESLEILHSNKFVSEPVQKPVYRDATGIGVVEAPRGTLYHKVHAGADGLVVEGEVIVPTGQNQVNIEKDIAVLVEGLLPDESMTKEKISFEIEKLIRAYDPCMSCGAHFLKVDWGGGAQRAIR